ncbi:YfcC family protein [Nesterenkonia sp. HG001]|uniref:YfcC family protein n=1 Tax=Nesterenkonia sp. HG001 TaxID=2983207 RepID=UPI002AC612C2|nr:TIGR00366 family protein [Nesterenkonia sp. HG001]MDZ5076360.1 AbgT family transporter [Nesterenkonia sp. HG001]
MSATDSSSARTSDTPGPAPGTDVPGDLQDGVPETSAPPEGPRCRGFRMPHIYVVLFCLSALAAMATHLIPAHQYARVEGPDGREVIDPGSYSAVAASPTGLLDFLTAIPRGLVDAGEVVFFTFVIGGAFMVVRRTGIIENALDRLLRAFAHRRLLLIPVLITVFATIATLIGTQELALVYIPVLIPVVLALGYDSVTAVAIALIGTTAGFTAGVLNPINTGLGQQIAGIETFSGAGLRTLLLVTLVVLGSLWTVRYARRVAADPASGLIHDDPEEHQKRRLYSAGATRTAPRMSGRQRLALVLSLPVLGVTVWGVSSQGWFMIEMAGMFLLLMVIIGMVSGLGPSTISSAFSEGMRSVLEGAIIVGVARSVAVLLEDGLVLDTIVHALAQAVSGLPAALAAVGMFAVQSLFNFVIPSGSGQAVVTMPIMAPLADLLDVTRQTAVLAFQLGDGPTNILYPTSGYFMAALAIGGVRWERWLRFYLPLFAAWALVGIGFLIAAQLTGWA